MEIKITLPDSGPMREVLATLVEYCRYERDHCAEEGRGTKPEWAGSFGCIVTTIEALPAQRKAAHYPNGMGEESRRAPEGPRGAPRSPGRRGAHPGCAAGMRVELWQDVARLVQAAGETCLGDGLRTTERLEVVRVRGRDVAVRVRTVDDTSLNPLLAACNAALKQAGFRQGEDLTGWECRVWEPDRILEEGIVRVIVVDPRGIGHDLTALADGTDEADGKVCGWKFR